MVSSPRGDALEQIFCEVAVRVNDAYASPGFNVLADEIAKERCFPGSGFPQSRRDAVADPHFEYRKVLLLPHRPFTDVCNFIVQFQIETLLPAPALAKSLATSVMVDEPPG